MPYFQDFMVKYRWQRAEFQPFFCFSSIENLAGKMVLSAFLIQLFGFIC